MGAGLPVPELRHPRVGPGYRLARVDAQATPLPGRRPVVSTLGEPIPDPVKATPSSSPNRWPLTPTVVNGS